VRGAKDAERVLVQAHDEPSTVESRAHFLVDLIAEQKNQTKITELRLLVLPGRLNEENVAWKTALLGLSETRGRLGSR